VQMRVALWVTGLFLVAVGGVVVWYGVVERSSDNSLGNFLITGIPLAALGIAVCAQARHRR
jgi:hypothetical protein